MRIVYTLIALIVLMAPPVVLLMAYQASSGGAQETGPRFAAMSNPGAQQSFVITVQTPTTLGALVPPGNAMPAGTLANIASDAGTVSYYYYNPASTSSAGGNVAAAPGGYWVPLFNDAGLGGH